MSSSVSQETQPTDGEVIRAKPVEDRKRIVSSRPKPNQIPSEILDNKLLNHKIQTTLPENYNFELHKTIWRLVSSNARRVALQFPEGLFVFAIAIKDIIEEFAQIDVFIMGGIDCLRYEFYINMLYLIV